MLDKCGYFARVSRHRHRLSTDIVGVYFIAAVTTAAGKPILLGHG